MLGVGQENSSNPAMKTSPGKRFGQESRGSRDDKSKSPTVGDKLDKGKQH